MLSVNIEGEKSMGQFSYAKPENKVNAHKTNKIMTDYCWIRQTGLDLHIQFK